MRFDEIDKEVKLWLKEVREYILSVDEPKVETKSNSRDLVTQVDKQVESYLEEKIKTNFPNSLIIGEEDGIEDYTKFDQTSIWTIDPIDGTSNFVKQRSSYCTMISYFENNEPKLSYIYEIETDKLYSAISGEGAFLNGKRLSNPKLIPLDEAIVSIDVRKNLERKETLEIIQKAFKIRYVGSTGLDGIRVVEGKFGAYISYHSRPWDYAPLILFAKETGLVARNINGQELDIRKKTDFIICNQRINIDLNKM